MAKVNRGKNKFSYLSSRFEIIPKKNKPLIWGPGLRGSVPEGIVWGWFMMPGVIETPGRKKRPNTRISELGLWSRNYFGSIIFGVGE